VRADNALSRLSLTPFQSGNRPLPPTLQALPASSFPCLQLCHSAFSSDRDGIRSCGPAEIWNPLPRGEDRPLPLYMYRCTGRVAGACVPVEWPVPGGDADLRWETGRGKVVLRVLRVLQVLRVEATVGGRALPQTRRIATAARAAITSNSVRSGRFIGSTLRLLLPGVPGTRLPVLAPGGVLVMISNSRAQTRASPSPHLISHFLVTQALSRQRRRGGTRPAAEPLPFRPGFRLEGVEMPRHLPIRPFAGAMEARGGIGASDSPCR
jgi:hypothetical protein